MLGVITIGINPEIHLGPLTLAWHGLTIAFGVFVGGVAAARWLRQRELSVDPLYTLGSLLAAGGIIGGRIFYLLEHDPADLLRPDQIFSSTGFTFDGGVILSGALLALYVRRTRLPGQYLDAVALGLPLGVAVGRIGDVINGEHYGARSDFFLSVRNSNPHALTPNSDFAYQNGGLYEVLLATLIFVLIWPLRHRLPRVGDLAWLVLGLFSIGRFFEFFARDDSPQLALGLSNAQWTSLGLLAIVVVGWAVTRQRRACAPPPRRPALVADEVVVDDA